MLRSEKNKSANIQKLAINKKNPQFVSNPHETLGKLLPQEVIIFPKFREDWTKIVDFLSMTNF